MTRLGAGKVRESAVGLCHTVTIFLFLEGGTLFVVSVNDFCFQTLAVRHTFPGASSLH